MHFGISEGKGGLKHGSRPWLGMDIFWNCPLFIYFFAFKMFANTCKDCLSDTQKRQLNNYN